MDVLVVLGTTAAWIYGVVLFFIGHLPIYESSESDSHSSSDHEPIGMESIIDMKQEQMQI